MNGLCGMRVVVVGAGVIGSVLSFMLQDAGARVVLVDPAAPGDNASGVAAGMLAPAFEAVLDPAATAHLDLLLAARDAWRGFSGPLADFGGRLERCGALWVSDEASQAGMLERLEALNLAAETIGQAAAERASPGLHAPSGALHTSEDWRLEPTLMLRALHEGMRAMGGEVRAGAAHSLTARGVALADGTELGVDAVVLATGMPPVEIAARPPELQALQPIKGQIARLAGVGPLDGPILRAPGVYVTPARTGAVIGATMEEGIADRRVEPDAISRLIALARPMLPQLLDASPVGSAGVRASTPDGLPMAGPSSVPGVWLALGARRNGWLLAPLLAQGLVAQLSGGKPGRWATLFDPLRFRARLGQIESASRSAS